MLVWFAVGACPDIIIAPSAFEPDERTFRSQPADSLLVLKKKALS